MTSLPFIWRAQRLADQVLTTFAQTLPENPSPGRLGMLRLRRKLDHLRASRARGLVPVTVDGYGHPVWVRAGTSDLDVLQQLFVQHELGFSMETEPRWIVDLGANIGLSAIYFARRFPQARILAVEVEDENFEVLRRNAESYPQIVPVHKAIWHQSGHVRISNPDAQPWSFRVEMAAAGEPGALEAISLNDLLKQHGIDRIGLLKMDIEGSEREVLSEGVHPWIDRTEVLAVELHERHRPGCEAALARAASTAPHDLESHGEYQIVRFRRPG